jgi:hypothetical protein
MNANTTTTNAQLTVNRKPFARLVAVALASVLAVGSLAPALAGSLYGPGRLNGRVQAYGIREYSVTFEAGETAKVFLSGDGDTDLDLYVLDEGGRQVWTRGGAVKDDGYTDDCYVEWVPSRTRTYTIRVVNRGRVFNDYSLLYN